VAPIRPTSPRSRAAASIARCAGQVMDLHEVDPAVVPVHRAGELCRALSGGWGPDLVGNEDLVTLGAEPVGEQALGVAVHRGRLGDA
jgi:hypothetical protein